MYVVAAWSELDALRIDALNSATSFNSNVRGATIDQDYNRNGPPFAVTFADDGTNLTFEVNKPGAYKSSTIYSIGRTAFLTGGADQIVYGIYDNTVSGQDSYTNLYGIAVG
jgi:hypothetical protein